MSEVNPRHIAYAISDLAADRVRASWRYGDSWSTLIAAGVPALLLRHVLDLEARPTEARRVIDGWDHLGARGLVAVVGAQDSGKSDAQARWALQRQREGLSTMWIDAVTWGRLGFGGKDEPNEIARLLREAEAADALIVDDIGAGDTQGQLFTKKMRGMILGRGERPTIISGNLNMAELMAWLGPKIESRLHASGRVHHIEDSLGMRAPDGNDDPEGRSPAWFEARKMVSFFGCSRVSRYIEATGEYEDSLDVGGTLADTVKGMGSDALPMLRRVVDKMGESWGSITAKGKRLGRIEELAQSGMLEAAAGMLDGLILPPRLKLEPKPLPKTSGMEPPPPLGRPPTWAKGDGSRGRLHAAGFRVRRKKAGRSWIVLFGDNENVMHPGMATEQLGWEFAAGLCEELRDPWDYGEVSP